MVTRFVLANIQTLFQLYSRPNNAVAQFRFLVVTSSDRPKLQHNKKKERPGHVTSKGGKTKTGYPTVT